MAIIDFKNADYNKLKFGNAQQVSQGVSLPPTKIIKTYTPQDLAQSVQNYGTLPKAPSFMMAQPTGVDLINKQIDEGTLPDLPKKQGTGKWLADNALAGISGFNKGVEQFANLMFPEPPITKTIREAKNERPLLPTYTELADAYSQQARETNKAKGKGYEIGGEFVQGAAGAIPQAALGFMTGGMSTAATLAPKAAGLMGTISTSVQTLMKNPAFWTSFVQTTGNTYADAKKEGASELEAQAAALINGFLGAGVEVGGGLETFKPGGGVRQWVRSMLDEGKEEVIQGIIENLTKKVIYDKGRAAVSLQDENAIINPLRAAKEFGAGVAIGGILGGAQKGISTALSGNIESAYKKAGGDVVWGDIDTWLKSSQFGPESEYYKQKTRKNYGKVPKAEQQVQNYGTLPQNTPPQPTTQQDRVNIPTQQETGVQGQEMAQTAKGNEYRAKQENKFINAVSQALSVPKNASKEFLRPIAQKLANEYMETGTVSKESADALFEEAYKNGIVVTDDYYKQYKDLKDHLRTARISISDIDKSSISDYNRFRKSNFNYLKITNDGIPVDVKYQELSQQYPELFPADITNPADQLQHISEVAKGIAKVETDLEGYHGDNAADFREMTRYEFDKELENFKSEMATVKRYNEDRAKVEKTVDVEILKENLKNLGKLKRVAEKAVKNNLLTQQDNVQVDRLLKGEITLDDVPKNGDYNIKGIKEVYEAKKAPYELEKQLHDYNNKRRAQMRSEAENDIGTIDEWKNPKGTWSLSISTMERVIRRIMPESTAEKVIEKYIKPVHKMEAERTRFKNKYRSEIKALNLTKKESEAVQFLGEVNYEIGALQEQQGKRKLPPKKGDRLSELIQAKDKFLSENSDLDMPKINNAINTFRAIYDNIFEQMNEARIRNGYAPVEYRKGYFPHFSDTEPDSVIGKLAQGLGIDVEVTALPTTIAGLTHTFKPGIAWLPNALQRKGNTTVYDAVRGFDKYIEGASDVIYHTDNIQRLRILSDAIRYRFSDDGTKARVDEIRGNPNMATEEKASLINDIYKEDKTGGSAFVQELEEYTNLLANKKAFGDRGVERSVGRTRFYNFMKSLESRVSANMVGLNIGSWLTNFIPLAQGYSQLKSSSMIRATIDTMKSFISDDGFENRSDFLTNRKGSDPLVKTATQKVSGVLTAPFQGIDITTSNILVRAKYYENVKNGMTEQQALEAADEFAAKVMADRSKGALPTIFNQKNPLTKAFTMFQVEVANQYGYLFEDLPRDLKEKGIGALAMALFKYMVASFIYNEIYEKITGRRAAFDPIGILVDSVEDFTDENMTKTQASINLAKNVAEEIPFVGGLIGGGRVPISSALPNVKQMGKDIIGLASGEKDARKGFASLGKEAAKPLTYLLPPFGGGQAKKIIEGITATQKGGSYSIDSQGRDVLQYPVGNKPTDIAKTVIFGKSSSPYSEEWVRSGFKGLSAKETEEYKSLLDKGYSPEEAYNSITTKKREEAAKEKETKAFNERMKREVPKFKYSDKIEELTKEYKEKYPEQSKVYGVPSIGIGQKDRIFKANDAIFILTDDLLIERQKIYLNVLENAYSPIVTRPLEIHLKMKKLENKKKKAAEAADLQFWSKHKSEIMKHKVNLPPKK